MRESEFIRRVAEAESVIRYTFRLEIPEAEQRLKGDLMDIIIQRNQQFILS